MNNDLVARIKDRLASASKGDRMYERPMSWEEADALLAMLHSPPIVAQKKLASLIEQGWEISGKAISKQEPDGSWRHGFVTDGGFVGWHQKS